MFAGKKSAQIREILISESAWEEMTCLFAPSLKEIVHFQVGSINLSTSIGVAHSNECTTVERLKMLADERLYKSKKNGRAQISWQ